MIPKTFFLFTIPMTSEPLYRHYSLSLIIPSWPMVHRQNIKLYPRRDRRLYPRRDRRLYPRRDRRLYPQRVKLEGPQFIAECNIWKNMERSITPSNYFCPNRILIRLPRQNIRQTTFARNAFGQKSLHPIFYITYKKSIRYIVLIVIRF